MIERSLPYACDGEAFEGVLTGPDDGEARPGILLAPNWLGVTPDAIARGRAFAERGYVVAIVDIYGRGRRPASMADAAAFADQIRSDPALACRRMQAALDALNAAPDVALHPSRRAAIGFCFGGGNVLELARAGAAIAAAVSFHGDLTSPAPAQPGQVGASLLVLHGAEDPVSPKADRDAFEAEMTAAGAHWQMLAFGGVVHAFTDVGVDALPVAKYDPWASAFSYDLADRFIRDAFSR